MQFDLFDWIYTTFWWTNWILMLIIVYLNRRRPSRSTMMWIMVLALFPILGFIPYLMMGQDTRRRKMFQTKTSMDMRVLERALVQWDAVQRKDPANDDGRMQDYVELMRLNISTGLADLSGDNEVRVFTDGATKFDALIRDIEAAQDEINLQYYILKSDQLGSRLIAALIRAAERGVRVRVLTDGIGGRGLDPVAQKAMRTAGIRLGIFFPSFLKVINLRINYRNHRKIVVIDDAVGYIGGFNVGDEYVGKDPKFGYWRDTHLRIRGSAVADLKLRFLQDWNYVTNEEEDPASELRMPKAHPGEGEVLCQLISSGPDTPLANIKFAMLKMIASANDRIYIQTPYFIPDISMYEALVIAIQQGVEVNLMMPDRPDHPVVYPASLSFAGDLIRAGANVYRYDGGFLHSKVIVVDDYIAMVGSCNMDERSFSLNFEASEVLYSPEVNRTLREAFEEDIKRSTLLTLDLYEHRPLSLKIKEPICRLFAPIL